MKVKLPRLTCPYQDCRHKWTPRYEDVLICPKCKRELEKREE